VISSWIELAERNNAAALSLAERAADREDAVDKHPVTPSEILPARELLGDMLLSLDRPADALEQYRLALMASPNRTNALLGAAKAAADSGETTTALGYYQTLLDQTESGNPDREGLSEAREYVAGNQ
jgi:tetratricopeptide (TPR) repeat protein